MRPEQVDQALKSYKTCVGRCEHLAIEIRIAKHEVELLSAERPELPCVHVQQYEDMDMPRGSGTGDPTQQQALMRADPHYKSPELVKVEKLLADMEREYAQRHRTVQYVDAWLKGLTEKDRWLIEQQVIEGRYWRQIAQEWSSKYGETLSKDHIRKLKAQALEKVHALAS